MLCKLFYISISSQSISRDNGLPEAKKTVWIYLNISDELWQENDIKRTKA